MTAVEGKRYLITGGASLVGSHICDVLLASGVKEILLFDNFSLGTPETLKHLEGDTRLKWIRGDVLKLPELLDACKDVDGVFALAGYLTLPMSKDPYTGVSVNTIGMLNTLEACRFNKVRRVVFSSSIAAYGNPATTPIDETTGYVWNGLQPASNLYGSSKIMGEAICAQYAKTYGVQYNALRFSSVYGARQHARAVNAVYVAQVCQDVLQGKAPVIYGDGSEVHDYVYVADVARACVMAMTSEAHNHVINIGTGVDTTHREVAELAIELTGKNIKINYIEDNRAVKSAASDKLQIDVRKARETIGWTAQVDVRQGMKLLIDWMTHQA